MGKISLEGLDFFAYHGVSQEEQGIGNRYSVDVEVHADFSEAAKSDDLDGTIDYSVLYRLIKIEMEISSKLLENMGARIVASIFKEFSTITKINLTVSKFNPPIGGVCTRAKVSFSEKRNTQIFSSESKIDEFYGLPEAPSHKKKLKYENPLDLDRKDKELSFLDDIE